jgi:hypothetical protein
VRGGRAAILAELWHPPKARGGFNFKAFQSNLVFRWEYNPGSTLVWNEGRRRLDSIEGTENFDGDVRDLFPPTPRQYIFSEDVVLAESLRGQIAPSSLPPNKALRRINV